MKCLKLHGKNWTATDMCTKWWMMSYRQENELYNTCSHLKLEGEVSAYSSDRITLLCMSPISLTRPYTPKYHDCASCYHPAWKFFHEKMHPAHIAGSLGTRGLVGKCKPLMPEVRGSNTGGSGEFFVWFSALTKKKSEKIRVRVNAMVFEPAQTKADVGLHLSLGYVLTSPPRKMRWSMHLKLNIIHWL